MATKLQDPHYLGKLSEAKVAARGRPKIVVELRGLSGRSGAHDVEYTDGQRLKSYLDVLGLKHTAIYAAIYDQQYPDRGRLRMTYIPKSDSRILICPPGYGLANGWQRTEVDVYQLMAKMKER